jgi:hypothetical protein
MTRVSKSALVCAANESRASEIPAVVRHGTRALRVKVGEGVRSVTVGKPVDGVVGTHELGHLALGIETRG